MIRAFYALILLLSTACGLSTGGKRPKYSGPIQEPLWKVDGIMVDQVFIGRQIVFCRARTFASPVKHLYAFDAYSGKQLWISDFEPDAAMNHFFVREVLVIGGADGQMHSVVAASGKRVELPFSQALRGVSVEGAPYDATYVVSAGRLAAYDNQRMEELWHAELKVEVADGPILAGPHVVVAGPADATRTVYAFDRKTGKAAWKWSVNGDASSLSADENNLYYSVWTESKAFVVAVRWSVYAPMTRKRPQSSLFSMPTGPSMPLRVVPRIARRAGVRLIQTRRITLRKKLHASGPPIRLRQCASAKGHGGRIRTAVADCGTVEL